MPEQPEAVWAGWAPVHSAAGALYVCPRCGAAVPRYRTGRHEGWHLAVEGSLGG